MSELLVSPRLLLGPGPSNVSYRVLRAMSTPLLGHLDPEFLGLMDQVSQMLRQTFQTQNRITFPVSGTGSAAMEAALANPLEPGDTAVICINGAFGGRLAEMAGRCGAQVVKLEATWGQPLDQGQIIDTLKEHPQAKLCAIVMAETSTGVHQPLEELGAYIKGQDTLLVVDTVTALAGVNLEVDAWGIDICYSGSQKCLSVPPGASPITFSPKAMDVITGRKSKIQNWYLDVSLLQKYWGDERVYHHTAPISMVYALFEGLRIVLEEGLQARIARHQEAGRLLQEGLVDMGFSLFAAEGYRLPQLTTAFPPDGVDVEATRKRLLLEENIEVGGGLGPVAGKIWRIGLLGENARPQVVDRFLGALRRLI